MATTLATLQTKNDARLAQALVFEGLNLIYTSEDATGMTTAYASTDWTNVNEGLLISGKVEQSISLFEGSTKPDTIVFSLVDHDGSLLDMFRAADTTTARDWLDQNIDSNDTSIPVDDTTDFAASGNIYIGQECIGYTSKTGAPDHTFNSATRGKFSLWGTSSDATRFGRPHRMRDTETPGQHQSPVVTDTPSRTWYNRVVALHFHHYENGAWSTKANSYLAWAGKIQSYRELGDGRVEITCTSIMAVLRDSVFANQLRGRLQDGTSFNEDLTITARWTSGASGYAVDATVTAPDTIVGWQEFAERLNEEIESTINAHASVVAQSHRWALEMVQKDNEWRMVFRVRDSAALNVYETFTFEVAGTNAYALLALIGFENRLTFPLLQGFNSSKGRQFHAQYSPIVYYGASTGTNSIFLETGEWINQPQETLPKGSPSTTKGFLKIGDAILAITEPDGTAAAVEFDVTGWYSTDTRSVSTNLSALEEILGPAGTVRLGGADRAPEAFQVWIEQGPADLILLKLLLSTGTSGYNHADYDVYGFGLGLGLPYTLIDVDSFATLRGFEVELILTDPKPFNEILESWLSASNHYMVWRDGQLGLVSPGMTSPYQSGLPHLTEDNKAAAADSNNPQRTEVEYGVKGIINRVTLEYDQAIDGTYRKREIYESVSSVSDFGQQRSVRIKGWGILRADYWREHVAAPAIAYFSRPIAIARRSIDMNMAATLSPGQAVIVDDNSVIDPRTGTRGIEDFPAWVISVEFDWATGIGEVELAFLPEANWTRAGTWSPSAQVASGTTFGSATTTIICEDHRFSHSSESVDAAAFETGDLVRIFPIDETSPTDFLREVSSVSSSTIELTASVTLTSGKTYVIEPQDTTAIEAGGNTSQFDHAFLADDVTRVVTDGVEDGAPYLWLHNPATVGYADIDYTTEYVKMDSVADDDGEPLSVRKMFHCVESLNNIYGVKTSPVFVNLIFPEVSTTNTSKLAVGPILIPWYAPTYYYGMTRPLKFKVLGAIANGASTATFTLKSTTAPVTGDSLTSLTYPSYVTSAAVTTQSTTDVWTSEGSLTIPTIVPGSPSFTWLTLESVSNNASHAATCYGLVVREAALGE